MQDLSNETVIHQKRGQIEYLQFRKLLEYPEVIQCYTLSANEFDVGSNDTYEAKKQEAITNYEKLSMQLQIDKNHIIRPYQTHTDVVECITAEPKELTIFPEELTNVDGLLTNQKDIFFSLTYADCTPIYLYDPIRKVVRKYSFWLDGNAKGNWKSGCKQNGR